MIAVSDIHQYLFCPRLLYLRKKVGVEDEPSLTQLRGTLEHAIRREISLRQSRILQSMRGSEDCRVYAMDELSRVVSDLPYIFGIGFDDRYAQLIPEVRLGVEAELENLINTLNGIVDDFGLQKALAHVTPWRTEFSLLSEPLGLKGRADKVFWDQDIVPVEIKTGHVPDIPWESDRIQLCAYGLLLEERLRKTIGFGHIEYAREQRIVRINFTEKLRRQVLAARDMVGEMLDGPLPDICPHGNLSKCGSCSLNQKCYTL